QTGCLHTANTAPCDDGNACSTNDVCSASRCQGGPPPRCDDDNPCTDDTCDPSLGCVHTNNANACDDGDACTTNDRCSEGGCLGGPPPNCDDANPCTDDSCISSSGCAHAPNALPCDDASACTTNDTCSDGHCVGGPPPDCNDQNPCTDDTCSPANGCK